MTQVQIRTKFIELVLFLLQRNLRISLNSCRLNGGKKRNIMRNIIVAMGIPIFPIVKTQPYLGIVKNTVFVVRSATKMTKNCVEIDGLIPVEAITSEKKKLPLYGFLCLDILC